MKLAVLARPQQKEEVLASPVFRNLELLFPENLYALMHMAADAYLDLEFRPEKERIIHLSMLLPSPVLVNSVTRVVEELHPAFVRVNGWPGFLKGNLLEAAAYTGVQMEAQKIFGEGIQFVPDQPVFISARIVAMIINEAFLTHEAGTASKEDIDIAMKLGTGYPFGPFEWAEKIGTAQVAELLDRLAEEDILYTKADSLVDS